MQKYAKLIFATSAIIIAIAAVLFIKPKSAVAPHSNQSITSNLKPITLFFAGDIMLSRNVDGAILEARDPTLPFQKVADEISSADISFANLESPYAENAARARQGLIFGAHQDSVIGLISAGFDILSTANNHAYDQGSKGIENTSELLAQHDIRAIGTGINCHLGTVLERNQIKFGFLAYSYAAHNDGGKKPDPLVCDANNLEIVTKDIQMLSRQADFVIVSVHMGTEYTRTPTAFGIKFAHNAIDSGADLVIGHHPHWIQTIEQYQGKWIFYSLGNFVFDQMWSQDTREGLAVNVTLEGKDIKKIDLMPLIIDNYCCPRWANEEETKTILQKINPGTTSHIILENGSLNPEWQSVK